jgi:hypothetical protein
MIGTSLDRSSIFWLKCVQILVNKSLAQTNISSCPQNVYIYDVPHICYPSTIFSPFTIVHYHETVWGVLRLEFIQYIYFRPSVGPKLHSLFVSIQDASHKCQRWLIRNYARGPITVKLKATVEWLTHLLSVREVSGPNLALYTGYTYIYNDFIPLSSDKCRNSS